MTGILIRQDKRDTRIETRDDTETLQPFEDIGRGCSYDIKVKTLGLPETGGVRNDCSLESSE
jgi:hypothetical protein